jgi:cold shock CspA family protein
LVARWKTDEAGKSKGFGFIERSDGTRLFCHKSQIEDGNALVENSQVVFDAMLDERKPGDYRATCVRGGVCFDHAFLKHCSRPNCRFSHAHRPVVIAAPPNLDDAVSAVVASRTGPPPVLIDTVDACRAACAGFAAANAVAVDFEGVSACAARDARARIARAHSLPCAPRPCQCTRRACPRAACWSDRRQSCLL